MMTEPALRKNWDIIWQTAVWVSSAVLLVLAAPPRFLGSELPSNTVIKLAELATAVCAGFSLFLFRTSRKGTKAHYAFSAICFLAIGIVLFLLYQYEYDAWTCSFDQRGPVTIGSSLLPDAAEYVAKHAGTDCEYLLQISAGKVDQIWEKREIIVHHLAMLATFLVSVLSLALAVLFITFAVTDHVRQRVENQS